MAQSDRVGRRSFLALSGACALCSCSGAVHQLPQISPGNLALAQAEVQEGGPVGLYRVMTDEQALLTLRRAVRLVRSPAERLCREMNVSVPMGHSRFAGQIARCHRPAQRLDHDLPGVAQLGVVLLHPAGKHRARQR